MFDDALSQSAAETQAFLVNEYWARFGYDAEARVERLKLSPEDAEIISKRAYMFVVRSNMKNGVPTRKIKEITQ